jgi:hypothetical protein
MYATRSRMTGAVCIHRQVLVLSKRKKKIRLKVLESGQTDYEVSQRLFIFTFFIQMYVMMLLDLIQRLSLSSLSLSRTYAQLFCAVADVCCDVSGFSRVLHVSRLPRPQGYDIYVFVCVYIYIYIDRQIDR